MPFIDSKVTVKMSDAQKETLKSSLGQAITTMNKTESYLMVGINDGYDLFMGGKKLDKGAYVEVSVFGDVTPKACDAMTGKICDIFADMLKQSTSTMAAMGRTACSASSSFSRSLGMDDLIMMSTSLSRPEAVPPGVGIERYFLIKYTKTDKSPSTKDRLRLAKKQKCYKKKRLPRFCTAALKIRS